MKSVPDHLAHALTCHFDMIELLLYPFPVRVGAESSGERRCSGQGILSTPNMKAER
jgi:hypothetical protein